MQIKQAVSRSHLLISVLIICLFIGSYINVLSVQFKFSEQEVCDGWFAENFLGIWSTKGLNYEARTRNRI